jgi:hypothetical protein
MNVKPKNPSSTCAICHDSVDTTKALIHCPKCKKPYHNNCWTYNNNHCAVLGCTGHTNSNNNKERSRLAMPLIGVAVIAIVCLIVGVIGGAGIVTPLASQKEDEPFSIPPSPRAQTETPTKYVTPLPDIIDGDWIVALRVNRAEDSSGNKVEVQDGGWVLRIDQDGNIINGSSIEGPYCSTVLTGSFSEDELTLNLSFNDQSCCKGLKTTIEAKMDTASSFSGVHYPANAIPQECYGLWADVIAHKK